MCRVALNKFSILISILLVLISFSCSNEQNSGELDFKKLEYNGYIFSEGKVSVFLKNYNKENYLVTLNSLSPEKETAIVSPWTAMAGIPPIGSKLVNCLLVRVSFPEIVL